MTEVLTTNQRKQAFKKVMRILGNGRKPKRLVCKNLYGGEDLPYKNSSDASSFLKDLVESDLPVKSSRNDLFRTDISSETEVTK